MMNTTPTHHPPDELLLDHASGNLSEAESLMIDSHFACCATCREAARIGDAIGGVLLDEIPPVAVAPNLFEQTMAAIGRLTPPVDLPPVWTERSLDPAAPLRAYMERRRLQLRPRWMPAGFRTLRVPFDDKSSRVWLMKSPGGKGPFRHTHVSDEWTVVLEGGYTDDTGTYAVGDFACAAPGHEHEQIAEPKEGCVCLLLIRDTPCYTTLPGRLAGPFIRL